MKRLHLIILCLCAICAKAQNLTHDFQGQSLSQALIWIDNAQSSYKLNFIFDELEDFTVTTSLKNVSVRDAVRQVCGFYPMHLTFDEQDIYIECTQKAETKLSGQIIDESGQPLPYVSITLLSLNDSTFLTGGISNEAGDFVIPCSLQRVLARFTCIGYKTIEKTCNVGNIGKIRMSPDQYTINGVEVKGHKRLVYTNDKGLVANVKGTALEQFSSVSEMLTHLPLMMSDGSIAGHGKPEIYINNKKVRNEAELKRYRADEILTAEIITNPGAEYGAEVTSVIKLKTVKRAGEGWSGSFSTGYRQGKENYASANASLNYRTHHGMDFFGGVYFNHLNQLINATANDQLLSSSTWNYQREAEWLYHFNYFFGDLGWNWDINERMKKRKAGMEPIDLLLVVGMFLTGFDAKKLNTLYVDKNLEYHGLLQAFSRTNRVLNEKKRFGKILCFRDLKDKVDESLKLFSAGGIEDVLRKPFQEVKRTFNELSEAFLQKYPTMESVDALKSEYDKKKFLLAFREIIKKRAEIQIYEDFDADDPGLILSEQDYNDYRSKYLDMTVGFIKEEKVDEPGLLEEPQAEYGDGGKLEDIDFCLELLHSDVVNVAYILSLISNLNPSDEDYEKKRQEILDTMIKDATMRKKTRLIDDFIKRNVDYDKAGFQRAKADGTMDLETRLKDYIIEKKTEAVEDLAMVEGVDPEALGKYMSEYDYLGREKPEIIQEAVRKKKMGLLARSATVRRIIEKMREIIELFSWE